MILSALDSRSKYSYSVMFYGDRLVLLRFLHIKTRMSAQILFSSSYQLTALMVMSLFVSSYKLEVTLTICCWRAKPCWKGPAHAFFCPNTWTYL